MACSRLFAFLVLTLIWTCFIEQTWSAAGWCYQCDSRSPRCGLAVDTVALGRDKTPCNGQCYTRIKEGVMSRGCSWEHGFMTPKQASTPVFEKDAMWIFCDTSLCNANANG